MAIGGRLRASLLLRLVFQLEISSPSECLGNSHQLALFIPILPPQPGWSAQLFVMTTAGFALGFLLTSAECNKTRAAARCR